MTFIIFPKEISRGFNISSLGKSLYFNYQLYFKVSHEEFDKRIDLDGLDTDSENDEL